MSLRTARRRRIHAGIDAASRCPVDLGQIRRQAPTIVRIDRVAEEPSAIGDHREGLLFGVGPALFQYAEHHRVERARFHVVAQPEAQEPSAHLAGGLAGEGQRERVAGLGRADRDAVGDPPGEDAGLARAGPGDHGDELGFGGDRGALVGVEVGDQPFRIHPATVRDLLGPLARPAMSETPPSGGFAHR